MTAISAYTRILRLSCARMYHSLQPLNPPPPTRPSYSHRLSRAHPRHCQNPAYEKYFIRDVIQSLTLPPITNPLSVACCLLASNLIVDLNKKNAFTHFEPSLHFVLSSRVVSFFRNISASSCALYPFCVCPPCEH